MLAHLLHVADEDVCRESYVVSSDLGMWSATTEAYIWQCFAHMRGGFRGRRSAGIKALWFCGVWLIQRWMDTGET